MERNNVELKLTIPAQEAEQLRTIAAKFNQTPEELLTGFIVDLTVSDHSNGESE